MAETPDMSANELRIRLMERFNIDVSLTTVTRFRRKLRWTQKRTHYCQMIRDANKIKCVEWCEQQLANDDTFDVSVKHHLPT